MSFPPIPTYPIAIDSDRTLFLVHNTSETKTRSNNLPWSQEIEIEPVDDNSLEIWANNGFANISGELFYYDSVGKNASGKVNVLKNCSRSINGKTKFNEAGTWVKGYVVAEHHNQLVQAIINLEKFIGINYDTDKSTLDFKIRHLASLPIIEDDHGCPDVVLEYKIINSGTGETGTLISYNLIVSGSFKTFRIEFGDGNFTTSSLTGTHLYSPNASIDPIVTISNNNCQMVQTGVDRTNPKEPIPSKGESSFEIDVPEPPEFPPIVIPNIETPQTTLTLPQINFPFELGFGSAGVNIPSVIIIEPGIPSVISFGPVDFGDMSITIDGPSISWPDPPDISVSWPDPPDISVSWPDPPDVSVTWDDPPNISVDWGDVPSIDINWGNIPEININWGDPPTIGPIEFGDPPSIGPIEFGDPPIISVSFGPLEILSVTFPDIVVSVDLPSTISVDIDWGTPPVIPVIFGPAPTIDVDWGSPPDIQINWGTPPGMSMDWGTPPGVSVDWGEPPTCSCTMTVTCPGAAAASARAAALTSDFEDPFLSVEMDSNFAIPTEINLIVPKIPNISLTHDLPEAIALSVPEIKDINLIVPFNSIPSEINVYSDIPSIINVYSDIPSTIKLEYDPFPTSIELLVKDLPDLKIDASSLPSVIQVAGIPDSIELIGNIPSEITLKLQENIEVPLVYKGDAIPVRFDFTNPSGEIATDQCFKLIPCGN